MAGRCVAHFLSPAKDYIDGLNSADRGAIAADIDAMQAGDLGLPLTKQLKGPIREIISGFHRITYFIDAHNIYFIRGFRKKTNKAPVREITYAEKIYKQLKSIR